MDGVGCFITRFHSSDMGIVALFDRTGFFAVSNGLIDGIGNISCGSKCIAGCSCINRTASTRCQGRFIDIERDGAVFVFGGRTCTVNEIQYGVSLIQHFGSRTVDLYADVLQCAVGFFQGFFGFV